MNFTQLQLLLMNDELHYNESNESEFILYENTCYDFNKTLHILNTNNIKYTIETEIHDKLILI